MDSKQVADKAQFRRYAEAALSGILSTHILNPPALVVDPIGSANTLSLPLYRDNFLRQLFATTANEVDGKASTKELTK